jgi:HEAT repeat protein
MGAMLLVICLLVVAVALIALSLTRMQASVDSRAREWVAAAQALRLRLSGSEDRPSMQGSLRGVPVTVAITRERSGTGDTEHVDYRTTFSAGGDGRIPHNIELRPDDPWGVFGRLAQGPDRETGDRGFDQLVHVARLDVYVCAALSARAREILSTIVAEGGSVASGLVTWRLMNAEDMDRRKLIERTELVVTLAELLAVTPDTLAERLAHNAMHDTNASVRLHNLRFLLAPDTHAPTGLVTTTARALLGDPEHAVRFHAARRLGVEGHATLQALASDVQVEPALRAQALAALHEGNAAGLDDWLVPCLTPISFEVARAALVVVAARQLNEYVARVIALSRTAEPALRAAAARTLGLLDSPKIELRLLELCADDEIEVQIAAAEALGTVGSVGAVEALLLLGKGLGRGQLREAARAAIARIQSRLGDVEAGRLSLVEGDDLAGAVAIAEPDAASGGELTLAPGEPENPGRRRA